MEARDLFNRGQAGVNADKPNGGWEGERNCLGPTEGKAGKSERQEEEEQEAGNIHTFREDRWHPAGCAGGAWTRETQSDGWAGSTHCDVQWMERERSMCVSVE